MSDCRFGVSPVNYPDPDPDRGNNMYFTFFHQSELPRPIKIRHRMYVRRSIMYEKAAFCSSEENSSVAR